MLFWLKKLISFWLQPLAFTVALMVVGLWLMRSPKRARLGRRLAMVGVGLLVLFSQKYVSRALIRPLETRYAAIPSLAAGAPVPPALARCRYVAVLGAGHGNSPALAANNLLSSSALGRLTEAVRLLRALPEAKLIVCGPGPGTAARPTHAVVLARAAEEFGIARERMIYLEEVRDTEDETRAIKKVVGEAPIALATSAWHMPRALALCRSAGVDALACPADFVSHADDEFYFTALLWDVQALGVSNLAIREHVGYFWIWLRRKT